MFSFSELVLGLLATTEVHTTKYQIYIGKIKPIKNIKVNTVQKPHIKFDNRAANSLHLKDRIRRMSNVDIFIISG